MADDKWCEICCQDGHNREDCTPELRAEAEAKNDALLMDWAKQLDAARYHRCPWCKKKYVKWDKLMQHCESEHPGLK